MRKMHFMPRLAAMFTLLGAVACSEDGTGPEAPLFDPDIALQDYDAVQLVMGTESFEALQSVVVGGAQVGSPTDVFDLMLRGEAPGRITAAFAQVISDQNRGKTFVYDPVEQQYVIDESLTDAPATGVRFLLYTRDGAGAPDVNDERGYFDLIDLGDNSTYDIDLQLDAVWDGNQFLSYGLQLEEMPQGGELAVLGYLSDGTERLDFDWSLIQTTEEATQTQTTDLDYRIWMTSRAWEVIAAMDVVADETGESATVTMTARHGARTVVLQGSGDGLTITGSITVNGELFVNISGSSDNPTFSKPDGSGLTAREIEALTRIFNFVERAFEFFGELMTPVGAIVFLGIIL